MASVFSFGEDNGAATATPARGTTRTFVNVTQVNWKNTDDVATAYSSSPITAGSNSYPKYQFGVFSGSFNQISNGLFQHVSGNFTGTAFTLKYTGTSGYATPATSDQAFSVLLTATGLVSTGIPVLFGGHPGPQQAVNATLATTGYTHYLATQLLTTAAAPAGDLAETITLQIRFDEN